MSALSIITPWHNHPELILDYEQSVAGAEQVIIVDNASSPENALQLQALVHRLNGVYIRNDVNCFFSPANNQGLQVATCATVMFLNNDIIGHRGWLNMVRQDVTQDDTLYGANVQMQMVAGQPQIYIEGWCIAAQHHIWDALGGWDAETYTMPYWDDVDLCFRARQRGYRLLRMNWPIAHLSNTTSRSLPGAYDGRLANGKAFAERVRKAYQR